MPDVQKLYEQSIAKLGKGTRTEMGQIRQDDFRLPEDQTGWPQGGKK